MNRLLVKHDYTGSAKFESPLDWNILENNDNLFFVATWIKYRNRFRWQSTLITSCFAAIVRRKWATVLWMRSIVRIYDRWPSWKLVLKVQSPLYTTVIMILFLNEICCFYCFNATVGEVYGVVEVSCPINWWLLTQNLVLVDWPSIYRSADIAKFAIHTNLNRKYSLLRLFPSMPITAVSLYLSISDVNYNFEIERLCIRCW